MPNEISIRTDKGEYVGGDTVFGSVYLCIREHVPSRAVKLFVRGIEISEFEYTYVEQLEDDTIVAKTSKKTSKKDLLKADITLIEYPGGFPIGCYAYAFMYQLPHNLPGVFHTQHEDTNGKSLEGIVKYTIGAILDIPGGTPDQRLTAEMPLVIYDSLECRNTHIAPDEQRSSGNVKTFFCINRGSIHATSRLEQSAHGPRDNIVLNLDLRNDSAVEVTGFTVKALGMRQVLPHPLLQLIRVIKVYGLDRTRGEEEMSVHTLYDVLIELDREGCNKNSTKACQVALDLVENTDKGIDFPPSTSGSIVKCHYVIDVDVHVPWAPDIEIRQPLILKPPPNVVWKKWRPPSWVGDCVQSAVTGSCAVPPRIISSQSFSGIPGFQPLL